LIEAPVPDGALVNRFPGFSRCGRAISAHTARGTAQGRSARTYVLHEGGQAIMKGFCLRTPGFTNVQAHGGV
jgi:hypothetical protein